MSPREAVRQKILSENDRVAEELRTSFRKNGTLVLNLVSSPGSGKTSLLEQTIHILGPELSIAMVAGDVQTENDADRLKQAGGKIVSPIITNGLCHLDARMVASSLEPLDMDEVNLLFIENVGNLVCPSSYDLGEDMKVVLISTTEGDDKPLKYPGMFRRSSVMIINKTDLLGTSDFELERVKKNAHQINGSLEVFELSCRSGDGLTDWFDWLRTRVSQKMNATTGSS